MEKEKPYKGTVLIVDDKLDSAHLHRVINLSLELAGYQPIVYTTANEALEAIDNNLQFDIALVDLTLEGESLGYFRAVEFKPSGEDLIDKIKQMCPKKPVISATGYTYKPKNSDAHLDGIFDLDLIPTIERLLKK